MKKELPQTGQATLLKILTNRFEKNINRRKGLEWKNVEAKLEAKNVKLWTLSQMEEAGGEFDVVGYDKKKYIYDLLDDYFTRSGEVKNKLSDKFNGKIRFRKILVC